MLNILCHFCIQTTATADRGITVYIGFGAVLLTYVVMPSKLYPTGEGGEGAFWQSLPVGGSRNLTSSWLSIPAI